MISPRRLAALCAKESRQIDPSSVIIALVLPLILLVIFGYGINLDSTRIVAEAIPNPSWSNTVKI